MMKNYRKGVRRRWKFYEGDGPSLRSRFNYIGNGSKRCEEKGRKHSGTYGRSFSGSTQSSDQMLL